MEPIVVAVGSLRTPKLDAVRQALAEISTRLGPPAVFEVVGVEVPSGVRHTPLSREEIMKGARQRAENLVRLARDTGRAWRYFAGLEGGVDVMEGALGRQVFLQNWACVLDGFGRESYGQSGAVALPESLVTSVVDQGIELSEAIDTFAGRRGLRNRQGAWGVLTGNLITRKDAFRIAMINAFAPWCR